MARHPTTDRHRVCSCIHAVAFVRAQKKTSPDGDGLGWPDGDERGYLWMLGNQSSSAP